MEKEPEPELKRFQESLPIFGFKKEIIKIILENDFCVITGDTGSGKSTQLPQYIMESNELRDLVLNKEQQLSEQSKESKSPKKIDNSVDPPKRSLNIVVTQPRRVAAISMAKRVAYERNCTLGEEIGYVIRFEDFTSSSTVLRFETDGILVRESLQDPDLKNYNIVILDEAHERSLFTDVLFALVKQAVLRRKGTLKLIITSATLNTDKFSKFFNNCPVMNMAGRCYPVDVKFNPCLQNKRVDKCVESVIRLHLHEGPGDILVFLTGSEECEVAAKLCFLKLQELKLKQRVIANMMIFTLYGSQNPEEQMRVFEKAPAHTRKLIFCTNIAETSLTVDGVGFVVDCGYVKQKIYNPRTGMDALLVVPISKVQAIQRMGRAGRTQAGKCLRLYSEQFYREQMVEHTVPEILRVSLNNVILTLKSMKIHDVVGFDYMEPPDRETVLQALKQLFLLNAIDENGKITELGREMSNFPLEPSYSKALISSILMNCQEDMLTLVSVLSTENIWIKVSKTNVQEYKEYEKVQLALVDMDGDHATMLKIYRRWERNGSSDSWCKEHFLNPRALKLAANIKLQLKEILKDLDLNICKEFYKEDIIYNIYLKHEKNLLSGKYRRMNRDQIEEEFGIKNSIAEADLLTLALITGFYFNCAKRVSTTPDQYLLLSEGNIVSMDFKSVYAIKDDYPDCVVFTELAGTSMIKGMMRLVSRIRYPWVEGYMGQIKSVNIYKLADISKENSNKEESKIRKTEDLEDEAKKIEKKEEKINEAKQRYLERKKLKTN